MSDSPDQFSAADSALGYLFQVRCALLWSLQKLAHEPDFAASIETLDDVSFEVNGSATDLLQTKLHKNRGANLTNASTDLWKTIRVWISAKNAEHLAADTVLYLVTTENAVPGTIAGYLKEADRDIDRALFQLEQTAQTSTNSTNIPAYQAYLNMSPADRINLISRIIVIDSAVDIEDIDHLLKEELFHACPREHIDSFLSYLEGWWFHRSVVQLKRIDIGDRILSQEIEAQMVELREQFHRDSLPIATDLLHYELDDATADDHNNFPFVQQIKLATENTKRVSSAIQDYYRAFTQRSRWQREELLFIADLSTYEKKLTEEWELVFAQIEDDLESEASESEKSKAARKVLAWAENGNVQSKIKSGVSEPFITRGSLHMLANDLKVGWHPDFHSRIKALIEGGAS